MLYCFWVKITLHFSQKLKKNSVVYAYFRIDENITILISPYCDYDEEDADAKVEL